MAQRDTDSKDIFELLGRDFASDLGFSFESIREELGEDELLPESELDLNACLPELPEAEEATKMNNPHEFSRGLQVTFPGWGVMI